MPANQKAEANEDGAASGLAVGAGFGKGELRRRLAAAKSRLRYHSRSTAGASKTHLAAGEARSLARADVSQLTHFLSPPNAEMRDTGANKNL